VDHVKKRIGFMIAFIGARLWMHGGWTGDECYEDLRAFGKLGYHVYCYGFKLMGVTVNDLEELTANL
jgi:hypothetical protein